MLPDDYENLCESIIATLFFSNNILAAITTKNYWNIANEYRPLMHTWYLGIVMEFYILYPLVFMLARKVFLQSPRYKTAVSAILSGLTVLSLILYGLPLFSDGVKFYFLPFRGYELLAGDLIAFWELDTKKRFGGLIVFPAALLALLCLLLFPFSFVPDAVRLLLVVAGSGILVMGSNIEENIVKQFLTNPILGYIGKRSYSIYIWHQILIAFCRYYFTNQFHIGVTISLLLLTGVLSCLSYRLIEHRWKMNRFTIGMSIAIAMLVCAVSGGIYLHAGVVRDVPELDIDASDVHRNMHAQYNDRVYKYTDDFPDNGKINVLIIGNSFARDWGNILLESDMAEKLNLSYSFEFDTNVIDRVKDSQYIFVFSHIDDVPQYIYENMGPKTEMWGIGTKSFGLSNGIIYKNRNSAEYFEQTARVAVDTEIENEELSAEWGDRYIDLLSLVRNEDGTVKVFTDENKFISQDCRHLTRGGAKYFAKLIDLQSIFGNVP